MNQSIGYGSLHGRLLGPVSRVSQCHRRHTCSTEKPFRHQGLAFSRIISLTPSSIYPRLERGTEVCVKVPLYGHRQQLVSLIIMLDPASILERSLSHHEDHVYNVTIFAKDTINSPEPCLWHTTEIYPSEYNVQGTVQRREYQDGKQACQCVARHSNFVLL